MKRLVWVLTLLALVAAACGGGDAGDTSDDQTSTSEADSSASAATLEEFFGWGEQGETDWQDQERQIQEMVATCMAELGWEYKPVDYSTQEYFDPFEDVAESEWAATYGYGATTFILDDPWLEFEEQEEFTWTDPNDSYVQSLSEIEQEQYYQDLYGDYEEPELDPDTGEYLEEEFFFDSDNGCYNKAAAEIYGVGLTDGPGAEADYEEVWELFDALEAKIAADPRVIEAEEDWSSCMADRGFVYDRPQEAAQHFYMQAERFWMIQEDAWVDPFDGWTDTEIEEWFNNTPQEEQDDFFTSFEFDRSFDEATTAEIETLSKEEIETAVADYECSEDMRDLQLEIREEYESQFIAENLEKLTEIKDSGLF